MSKRLAGLLALIFACAALVAACGGDDNGGGGGGTTGTTETGTTKGAPVIDVSKMDGAKGNVTYCTGKDTSGDLKEGVKKFNEANPGITVKLLEFPESADEQRAQFIQRQRAKSADCDMFESDVIWTAEFASQKWLYDLSPYIEKRKADIIPSTLETVHYDGKYWGVPRVSDTGLLFYRKDQVSSQPQTWQDVYSEAAKTDGIVYQGASYEGLTCDYLELAFAAGGKVLSDDGTKSEINSPENLKALQFMVDGIKNGAAKKSVATYMEEDARRAFESGKATFERNWPYVYSLGQQAPKIKGKFETIPLPEFQGGGKAGILGGHNMVISAYSKNPGAALKVIEYFSSPEVQAHNAIKYSKTPVLEQTYDDPKVKKAIPFSDALKQGIQQAHSRPVSPVYTQVSQAIYKNVNQALSGQMSPEDALKNADTQINQALKTF